MDIQLKDLRPFVRYAHFFTVPADTPQISGIPYEPRIFYLKSGRGGLSALGQQYEMQPGSIIFVNSGIEYRFLSTEETAEYIGINFDFTFRSSHLDMPICLASSRETYRKDLLGTDTFSEVPELNGILLLSKMNFLEELLTQAVAEYSSQYFLFREKLCITLFSVLIHCLREARTPDGSDQTQKAERMLEYIREHYPENVTNESLGEIFHFHPNYVNRIIKERTGFSAHQYVLHVRISQAARMLTELDYGIAQVAEKCGFFDTCHFTKVFRQRMGVSPSEFRRRRV